MDTPKNLKYAKTHEWVEFLDDSSARIGLTDYAQKKLGKLVFVNLPLVGDELSLGQPLGDVESVKAVSDVISPLEGNVAEINEALLDAPGLINDDPYGAWLVKADDITNNDDLLSAEEYDAFCESEE